MDKNYGFLRLAVSIFKVLAWVGVALGIVSSITILVGAGTPETPRWMGAVALIVGAVYLFIFLVASEIIKLLLEIKEKIR